MIMLLTGCISDNGSQKNQITSGGLIILSLQVGSSPVFAVRRLQSDRFLFFSRKTGLAAPVCVRTVSGAGS